MKKLIIICSMICGVLMSGLGVPSGVALAEEIDAPADHAIPEIYIKAINPGYTVDGKNNVGEMIEIARKDNSDTPISLAGWTVSYTNSSGTTTTLVEFPEHSWMAGENILLRLSSSPGSELAALKYSKTLAFKAGPLKLMHGDEVIDTVCWSGGEDCYAVFKSANPTVLVRDTASGEFSHVAVADYEVKYDENNYYVEESKDEGYGAAASQCVGVKFSEILTYYAESKEEQFIELYNAGAEQVLLDGCQIKYKNKYYVLQGVVKPEEYYVAWQRDLGFSLTKNPTNSNTLELIDTDGTTVDTLIYPNGQRKGTAYAWVGYDGNGEELWRVTYAPTPGAANNYQEYKTCEAGKVINEATGNCVKVTSVAEKVCGEGKYLNILTGRCKKIEETTEKTCKEGYYLNPATNRCNKIKENTGADYSLGTTENYEESSSFVALYVVLAVAAVGVAYVVYEFRTEIARWVKRVTGRGGGGAVGGARTGARTEKIRRVSRRVLEKLRRGTGRR